MLTFMIAVIFAFLVPSAWAENTAYEDTLAGKQCKESRQQLNCSYNVGKDLAFSIDGIGMPDTGITFTRSKGIEGDYYPTFGLMHGCIIVKHGGGPIFSVGILPLSLQKTAKYIRLGKIAKRVINRVAHNNATGADGVKIAVLRKGLAGLKFIWAAAHWRALYAQAKLIE